jgi:hypothetical protein
MNEQRAKIDRAEKRLEKLAGMTAALKEYAERSESALRLAQDRKLGKRFFSGVEHGREAWRRARGDGGLAGTARRLFTDQKVHAELRSSRSDLRQAYARIDAKRRGHRAISALAKLTPAAGVASLAALPQVRERVSALISSAARKRPHLEDLAKANIPEKLTAANIPGKNGKNGKNGARPHSLENLTKEKLYERAQKADIPGRSDMSKEELIDALRVKG